MKLTQKFMEHKIEWTDLQVIYFQTTADRVTKVTFAENGIAVDTENISNCTHLYRLYRLYRSMATN